MSARVLPQDAVEILTRAYMQASDFPKDSLARAEIIDRAIKRVKRQYAEFFRKENKSD